MWRDRRVEIDPVTISPFPFCLFYVGCAVPPKALYYLPSIIGICHMYRQHHSRGPWMGATIGCFAFVRKTSRRACKRAGIATHRGSYRAHAGPPAIVPISPACTSSRSRPCGRAFCSALVA